MKKALALILSLMIVAAAAMAFAEEKILNWSEMEESAAQAGGEFQSFDAAGLKVWIPASVREVELTDENRETGYVGYYAAENDSLIVAVVYLKIEITTREDYIKALEGIDEVSNITNITVNGIPAVLYDLEAEQTSTVSVIRENGNVFEITVFPTSDDDSRAAARMIFSSIQQD